MNKEQLQRMKADPGFVAALDQSGGSTPHALRAYGIEKGAWSTPEQMFDLVHQMRTRIITSPRFTGERILAAILFENTIDRDIEGMATADYLWNVKRVVPFLKVEKVVDRRLGGRAADEADPELAALLERPGASASSGPRCARSSTRPTTRASRTSWPSSSRSLGGSSLRTWCRLSSRKSTSTARTRPKPKSC